MAEWRPGFVLTLKRYWVRLEKGQRWVYLKPEAGLR